MSSNTRTYICVRVVQLCVHSMGEFTSTHTHTHTHTYTYTHVKGKEEEKGERRHTHKHKVPAEFSVEMIEVTVFKCTGFSCWSVESVDGQRKKRRE